MNPDAQSEKAFTRALVESAQAHKSWRARLQWVRDRLVDPAFQPTPGRLATVAIYLRFLATGELPCAEDGGHYRPNHSAEAALQIEAALERMGAPETAWILRRIYPYLPSWGEEFRRAEPLTRIRDIAHRNDIPQDLKREIKTRLQNKLHRSAGPEDLRTTEELLARVTAPGAAYSPDFVREFKIFHGELQEFFNAEGLETRLRALARGADVAEAVNAFLALKTKERPADDGLLELLDRLTALRRRFAETMVRADPHRRSQLRLADVGLEDYAFTLLSEIANRLEDLGRPGAWAGLLRALAAALDNLRLSHVEPEECAALRSEVSAWARDFRPDDRFHMLRLLATLARARRLAEGYAEQIGQVFPPRVEELGRALGVAEHAVKLFSEGDLRAHVIFQLSKLVDMGLEAARRILKLPPWEAIVPGEAGGKLVRAAALSEVEGRQGPLLLLLDHADGDAEIPAGVKGIALGHPMPMLSHLGVRARQARIPFAASADRGRLAEFEPLVGKDVRLRVTPEGLTMEEGRGVSAAASPPAPASVVVPEAVLAGEGRILPLDRAEPATCGAKATGARRLLELAGRSGGLFRAPRGLALPFGAMQRCLDAAPDVQREYLALQERVPNTPPRELDGLLGRLGELLRSLPVPDDIGRAAAAFFGPDARLAVRSSANGEDLENLAGAGLYESVVNVPASAGAAAIGEVWASLWTRRAALSRAQAGIPHARIRMAVLLQELVVPDLSFILHTANPLTGSREEALAELAVGLGEALASASLPGEPYRMVCRRAGGEAGLSACSTFSVALRPSSDGAGVVRQRLDYSRVALSSDRDAAPRLGSRLASTAALLEEGLGGPQDVEGVCAGQEVFVVQARPQQGL
jgi:phosphoglucan,water dikinase